MKKNLVLALALFALMAVGLYAQTEADFSFEKRGSNVVIDDYMGSATTVKIPEKIQNLPVTVIMNGTFRDNKKITSVTIPNSVTMIMDGAFSGCTGLTNITIPNSVTDIDNNAFKGCTNLSNVIIGTSVTFIGNNAFESCTKLASITIPASVTSIGADAFRNCTSLISVTFGGTIPSSGFHANAFRNLGDIRDKYLAANGGAGTYTRANGTATTWTKSASSAAAPSTVAPSTAEIPGVTFELTSDKKGYIVNSAQKSGAVVIPASINNLPVTTIGSAAFHGAPLITSVTIPESVTRIERIAFSKCLSLNSVTFEGAKTYFTVNEFPGNDLLTKYQAGGAGTYTRNGNTWTKK